MGDLRCPKCGENGLRSHSVLKGNDIKYEWECYYCHHTEGEYNSTSEAKEDYERKYGGKEVWQPKK